MRRSRWSRTLVVLLLVASMLALVGAGPPALPGNGPSDNGVPPGFTRVTHIFYGGRAAEKIVEHGPGNVPPPRRQEGSVCPDPDQYGTDQCATNSWSGNKWFDVPVEWSLNLLGANIPEEDDFEAAFEAGSGTWMGAPNSSFDATYLGMTEREASSFRRPARTDGKNDVDFGDLRRYADAIAVVMYWYSTDSGEIVEADMRMNKKYSWTTNGGFIEDPDTTEGDSCCFDVQNIATHEFGHFHAGLNDLYDDTESELTMYGYGVEGEVKKRTLGLGDELSIASAYPPEATGNPPVANVGSATTDEDTPAEIILSGSDDETCELSFSIVSGPGNGTLGAIADQICTSGTPNTDAALVTYSPNADYNGSDSFVYRVTDAEGASDDATVSMTVNAVNDAPVANDDSATTQEDVVVTIDVVANDTDADGDSLTVTDLSKPANGTATPSVDGKVVYTPDAGFVGEDTFTYTAHDGTVYSNVATVTVTVSEAGATMHVEPITIQPRWAGRNLKAQAEVRIVNEHGEGVSDATVTGDWSLNGVVVKPGASGVTGSDGIALVNSGPIKNVEVGQTIKFCVTRAEHATLTFEPGVNDCGLASIPSK